MSTAPALAQTDTSPKHQTMTTAIDKRRKALLAQIHIVRKQLVGAGVLDEDGYREALRSATTSKFHTTGKDSCTLMSEYDLQNALRHLRKIAALHKLQSTNQTVPAPYAGKAVTQRVLDRAKQDEFAYKVATARPLEKKLWALWNAMGRAGKLETPTEYGLYAFVKRRTDCERPRFCTDKQLHDLIEQVKAWDVRHAPAQTTTAP